VIVPDVKVIALINKKRNLRPAKLAPPPDVMKKMRERDDTRLPRNKAMRFFTIFFGEGF